jgi:hypothetical protein
MRKKIKAKPRGRGWTAASGRRAARVRWDRAHEVLGEDVGDVLARAALDRKGRVLRMVEWVSLCGKRSLFGVRWSLAGRCDQFDLFDPRNGQVLWTGGRAALGRRLADEFLT